MRELQNKTGFGFLRLPEDEKKGTLKWEEIDRLVDAYMSRGGIWFDTCYTYMDGMSEEAARRCVVERKDRDSFKLIEKLPGYLCHSHGDCYKYFQEEQKRCGTEYFDVFMLHWLNQEHYDIAQRYDQFGFLQEIKEAGLAGRIGFSYHDSAALLDQILTEHPEVDVVLLQINYLDWESAGIESRKCYDIAVGHGKSVFAMEPVRGGTLAKLPAEAEKVLKDRHPDWTPADWALRFVQSLPGVELCLSGMNRMEQIEANQKPFPLMREGDFAVLDDVCEILRGETDIPCTGCRYCTAYCPQGIAIPDYFRMYNELQRWPDEGWKIRPVLRQFCEHHPKPSACTGCKSCEAHCPQHIAISEWIGKVQDI
ncbi:MAG: aldo/keto reductase [Bacillota bacterium]|nr:aldo/keto reductase [Bacillota bacterium]